MDGHLRTCTVDGLNLGESIFNWNDKLIIFHNKDTDKNIVNIHTIIPSPYRTKTYDEPLTNEENEDQGDAFETVTMFLACYHLMNDLNMPKIITHTWSAMNLELINSIDDVKFSGFVSPLKSSFDVTISVDTTLDALNKTKPLFEQLMNLPKKVREPISVALIFYQKSRASDVVFTQFLDLVTVLETLFTENDGEQKQKFASRTSIFYERDTTKRIELFEKLRIIYKNRSELVHGNKISLNPHSVYHDHFEFLLPMVFKILSTYIGILSDGHTKKDIINLIDKEILDKS